MFKPGDLTMVGGVAFAVTKVSEDGTAATIEQICPDCIEFCCVRLDEATCPSCRVAWRTKVRSDA